MINLKSTLKVIDNSGVMFVECIRIVRKKKNGTLGDYSLVIVKKLTSKNLLKKGKNFKKGDLVKGIIVQVKKPVKRFDGSVIKFFFNSIVLVNNQFLPLGTRISGVLPIEILRKSDNKKLISLASIIL